MLYRLNFVRAKIAIREIINQLLSHAALGDVSVKNSSTKPLEEWLEMRIFHRLSFFVEDHNG